MCKAKKGIALQKPLYKCKVVTFQAHVSQIHNNDQRKYKNTVLLIKTVILSKWSFSFYDRPRDANNTMKRFPL